MKNRKIKTLILSLATLIPALLFGQTSELTLTLDGACRLAESSSLSQFINKNNFLSNYWQYKSYKANFLPELSLNSRLLSYQNSNNLRYNSVTKTDDYVHTQNLNSNISASIRQNVGLTGGSLFISSNLDRNQNFGDEAYTQYASRPFTIGYNQKMFGYNELKWSRILEPKRYEKAKRQYLYGLQQLYITTCTYFFSYALAMENLKIAQYNIGQTEKMVHIARERFKLGTYEKDQLLQLELESNNQSIKLKECEIAERKSREKLMSFLRLPTTKEIKIILPSVYSIQIDEREALDLAKASNVQMLENELTLLQDKANVARTKANASFQANLGLSYGINKTDGMYDYKKQEPNNGTIPNVYKPSFDDYQSVQLTLTIPILDWGRRRGEVQKAKSQQEVNRIKVEQSIIDFEQMILTNVLEFNIQYDKVKASERSQQISEDSYKLISQRFMNGSVEVMQLNNAQMKRSSALVSVIQSKFNFWKSYYTVRLNTMYDFKQQQKLEVDFDELIKRY
ncbi:TolC family protein [Halosquirtibacter laminarini]|uniref:TolC family protein n=1 Tax=Halosquirtibacter laminarini TaxID=3374600 RepID=A0AC61NNP0_9BACT|nr:TolC family protein [Prolixibacteraceae bacterium]